MGFEVFPAIDLMGTFVFAVSGALAAIDRQLDIFGVFVVAFVTACGGGVIRDLCIGALPPAGLINIEYLVVIALAVALAAFFQHLLLRLAQRRCSSMQSDWVFLLRSVPTKSTHMYQMSNCPSC